MSCYVGDKFFRHAACLYTIFLEFGYTIPLPLDHVVMSNTPIFPQLKTKKISLCLTNSTHSLQGRSRCVDEKLRALENVDMALCFLHERGLQLVNIDATNITSGDATLTLGMLWIIILKFQVPSAFLFV